MAKNWTFWPLKTTLRAIQPNPSYDMLLISSQRSLMPKKRKKLLKRFWDWPFPPPPLKVDAAADDADDDADDGRVGIWKAPLPDGTGSKCWPKVVQIKLGSNYAKHYLGIGPVQSIVCTSGLLDVMIRLSPPVCWLIWWHVTFFRKHCLQFVL